MAITLTDFTKIWASTSPLTPYTFSESNYKEGWNFVGGTPPARQMWDSIQKQNDEKLKYIVDNFLPLAGGTITGDLEVNGSITNNGNTVQTNLITEGTLTPLRGTLGYYYLNKNNRVVQCGGFLQNMTGSVVNTWTSLVTIQEGFRPSGRIDFVMANNDSGWGIQAYIDTDGTVYAWATSVLTSVRWNVFYFVSI